MKHAREMFCSGMILLLIALMIGDVFALGMERPAARKAREPQAGLLFYAKSNYATNTAPIDNPYIIGSFFQIIWGEVEKEKGKCDWTEVDAWMKPWTAAGKKVALRVMWSTSGRWPNPMYKTPTPQWVWKEGAKFAYEESSQTEIPMIWDPIYKKYSDEFLKQVQAKYGDDPNVLFIDVTPGAETNPYRFGTLGSNTAFSKKFLETPTSDGKTYSNELWFETVKSYVDSAAKIFPTCPLLVTLNQGGINPPPDRGNEIGSYCVQNGFYVGQNGLQAKSYVGDSSRKRAHAQWAPFTKFFFEMVAKTGGRTGTLMEVMQAAERIHCAYVNVYPEDVLMGTKGQKDYDPAYEEALKYGAERIGKYSQPISSGNDQELGQKVFTYESSSDIKKLEALYKESQEKKGRTGRFVYYIKADTDGSVQPVGVFVPEAYDKGKKYPFILQLHGIGPGFIGGTRAIWPGMKDPEWIDPKQNVIIAQAYARQNSGYRGIGEAELLQIIREMKEMYNIDPDRTYVMGHSMGGGGTINLALHYPDMFAGFTPIDAAIGAGGGGGRRGAGGAEQAPAEWLGYSQRMSDPYAIVGNALNLPLYMQMAGTPEQNQSQVDLADAIKAAGDKIVSNVAHEGMPHHFAAQIPYHTFIPDLLKNPRVSNPDRVTYKTSNLRYNKAYWITIDSLEKNGEYATVDAQWQGPKLTVKTENIDRLTLDLSKAPQGATVVIDGTAIDCKDKKACTVAKQGGKWQTTDQPIPAGMKHHGVQGPVWDAFAGKFLLVYGNEADMELARAEVDAIRAGGTSNQGDYPYKQADEVTADDVKSTNLILFGTAETNSLIKKYMGKLPIQVTENGVKAGEKEYAGASTVFIAPNPENQAHYVIVWTGAVLSAGGTGGGRSSGLMSLPDYIVFSKDGVQDAGVFNDEWKR